MHIRELVTAKRSSSLSHLMISGILWGSWHDSGKKTFMVVVGKETGSGERNNWTAA